MFTGMEEHYREGKEEGAEERRGRREGRKVPNILYWEE